MACRYLFSSTASLSNVGRLALLGLILSVAVLVIVLSVVNGFERELQQRVLTLLPQLTVEVPAGYDDKSIAALLEKPWPGVSGSARYVQGTVLLSTPGQLRGATATGIDPEQYRAVAPIADFTASGGLAGLAADQFNLILGEQFARELQVGIGDEVRMILPAGQVTAAGAVPRQRRMKVVDIFASHSLLDSQAVYLHIDIAHRFFRHAGSQGIHARLQDLFSAASARAHAQSQLGMQVQVRSWVDRYGNLYQAIAVQKLTMFVLLSFLVAVAAFNLVSGLVMIVEQRKQDVAVLRTLGYQSGGVVTLFIFLGSLLSLVGVAIGLMVGAALAYLLPETFSFFSIRLDLDLMNQYFISYLPVDVRMADLGSIAAIAGVMSVLATVFPAWRATTVEPSLVLAHE